MNLIEIEVKYVPLPEKPTITRNGNILVSSFAESYQWYGNDEKIEGAVEREYRVLMVGEYSVEIADENTCKSISDPVDVLVSVDDNKEISDIFEIHPNPNNGNFYIESNIEVFGTVNFLINNILGTPVLKESFSSFGHINKNINLQKIPAGIYLLIIKTEFKTFRRKIVIN